MWLSHVHMEVTKIIKIKLLNFFLLPLKLNIIFLKILSDLSQFDNPFACCKYTVRENLHKGSRIN